MTWEDKQEMAKLLDNGKYKEATQFYIDHEVWNPWEDVQALSIFANAMDLTHAAELRGFEGILKELQLANEERYSYLDYRASIRLAMLQDAWEDLDKQNVLQ